MSVQIIEKNGQPEWAVLPYEEYQRLVDEAEMLQDIRDYDEVKVTLANGEEELIPSEVTSALLDGENPIIVFATLYTRYFLGSIPLHSMQYFGLSDKRQSVG